MNTPQQFEYRLINGEDVVSPLPDPEFAAYLQRVRLAAEDRAVGEEELIVMIYSPENPLMDADKLPARGMVTRRTLDHPLYRVMMDYLDRKRVQRGTLDLDAIEAAYTVTVPDAATILDVHPSAVRQAIQSGKLTVWKKSGQYYLRPESLESYDVSRRGPRSDKPAGGAVLRIRCGHAKGVRFAINVQEHGTVDELYLQSPSRRQRQRLMAEWHSDSGVVEGLLPAGWLRIGVLVNAKESSGQRFFVLGVAEQENQLEFGGFFVRGRFRVAEKENNSRRANEAYKTFNAKWTPAA